MWLRYMLLALVGVLGGVISGMGMGGGTLLIPMLTIFFDVNQVNAQCINLISFLPVAFVSLIIHIKNHFVQWKVILWLIVPSILTSIIGALITNKIDNKNLKLYFGIFLILLAIYIIISQLIIPYVKKLKSNICE